MEKGLSLMGNKLRVGFIGAGAVARAHARAFSKIPSASIVAVYSRTTESARSLALYIEELGLQRPRVYGDLHGFLADRDLDAVWILTPNYARLDITKAIVEEVVQGKSNVKAVAVEKPLARYVREAREMLDLVEKAGLLHGYLENLVFMPTLSMMKTITWIHAEKFKGRPYLARVSGEHAGPYSAWFWRADLSGGGALLDMGCHSIEASRYLLFNPNLDKNSLKPKSVYCELGFLKWVRDKYAEELKSRFNVDLRSKPVEDYSLVLVNYEDEMGNIAISEARSAWSYDGPSPRLAFEVYGPGYGIMFDSLSMELKSFPGRSGKISSERIIPQSEEDFYGYVAEDAYMVSSFLNNKLPEENWYDGLLVVQLLMHGYLSAEQGRKVHFNPSVVEDYVPYITRMPRKTFFANNSFRDDEPRRF